MTRAIGEAESSMGMGKTHQTWMVLPSKDEKDFKLQYCTEVQPRRLTATPWI